MGLRFLSDNNQGIKTNVGSFGEYVFIPHIGTVLGLKDAKETQTGIVGTGEWLLQLTL